MNMAIFYRSISIIEFYPKLLVIIGYLFQVSLIEIIQRLAPEFPTIVFAVCYFVDNRLPGLAVNKD